MGLFTFYSSLVHLHSLAIRSCSLVSTFNHLCSLSLPYNHLCSLSFPCNHSHSFLFVLNQAVLQTLYDYHPLTFVSLFVSWIPFYVIVLFLHHTLLRAPISIIYLLSLPPSNPCDLSPHIESDNAADSASLLTMKSSWFCQHKGRNNECPIFQCYDFFVQFIIY